MVVTWPIFWRSLLSGFIVGGISVATMFIFPPLDEPKFDYRVMVVFFFVGFFLVLWQLGTAEAKRRAEHAKNEAYNPQTKHNRSSHHKD